MKAILFDQPGPPEVLYLGEVPVPSPGKGELLLRVRAAALNRADLLQRKGNYPALPGESPVLGLELAGEVVAVGSEVAQWTAGQAVCGLVGGGAYAEYALLREELAWPLPEGWTWEMGAAIPEAFLTAWQSLVWLGKTQPGERVLIHAGASGVGTAAIQLARELGAEVWVTASAAKHALCLELGAFQCIDYKTTDFVEAMHHFEQGVWPDVIVDCIGGSYFQQNLQALRMDGRLVILALMGGARPDYADLSPLLRKRLTIMGSTLRNRSLEYKSQLARDLFAFAWPRFADGRLKSVIGKVFPWTEAVIAHHYMETNQNQGKIVLTLPWQ